MESIQPHRNQPQPKQAQHLESSNPRIESVAAAYPARSEHIRQLNDLVSLAIRGLTAMYEPGRSAFPQTMRGARSSDGPRLSPEGDSLRYAAMVALGLSCMSPSTQRRVLASSTAVELARSVARRAVDDREPGAVALAVWALAEVADESDAALLQQLTDLVDGPTPLPTVVWSWALTAAVAAAHLVDTSSLAGRLAARLLQAQGPQGLFPHMLPASSQSRFRAHVGCYADQVYPIQALARFSMLADDLSALEAANRCASRLCSLQGPGGQWWWHYDFRDGSVVERFPVYSVHQHAMGPMALLELREAGGSDHRPEVAHGVQWLDNHPEVMGDLVSQPLAVVWRKVGRREPRKASRMAAAVTTSVKPGLHLPGVDAFLPPDRIDYECRPYELGWLLYAWNADGVVESIRSRRRG